MIENFGIYMIKEEFYKIFNWEEYKIPIKADRPMLILIIENKNFPEGLICIPITKDDDKNGKISNLADKRPDFIHNVEINHYNSYLLIQNMYIIHKSFIGDPYTLNGIPFEIKNPKVQAIIKKKVNKVDQLLKRGVIQYVPREEVYQIQMNYLNKLNF
ncbi:hypothetical protein [Sporosarcina beigongshangi]|uniref:hypothetical protein n=1 Tax=Sporosarcina beigongshangi TaxID=2782538 RepID=UPI001939E978|nr:hypothetical protein [Sporosarcina beigongshangi]